MKFIFTAFLVLISLQVFCSDFETILINDKNVFLENIIQEKDFVLKGDTSLFHSEYTGGSPYYEWVTLILLKNGKYKYNYHTHSGMSIDDKGKWQVKGTQLILNSSKKNNWNNLKDKEANYFFLNFIFNIENDQLISNKDNNFTFSEGYFNLKKSK